MPNWGKVHRLVRELVAGLVDELGPDEAVKILDDAAAQLRAPGSKRKQAATQERDRAHAGRKLAKVVDLKR